MIITIQTEASNDDRAQLMSLLCRISGSQRPITTTRTQHHEVIVLDLKLDAQIEAALRQQKAVANLHQLKTPYQLVSRAFQAEDTVVVVGEAHGCQPVLVGKSANPVIIAGPCSVEDREQVLDVARRVRDAGAHMLRGGAFKPRTSPYQFQGLGIEGLHLLDEARDLTGLPIVTEVMEPGMVDVVAKHADMLQIGTRNMQNYPLLTAVGKHNAKRPVLLKRGLASTLDEWLQAAEYIIANGNPNVILCERGIRSYDPQTRNVLDLTCVPLLQQLTHLPVIVDPSHATGKRELVPIMSRACIAAEAKGLIIEVHPDPDNALTDGRQSITPEQLSVIVRETEMLARMLSVDAKLISVA
jgi:3-deoxy-7-phosphoheptulonate synthase